MNNRATLPHTLVIGERKIPVRDLVDASHAYLLARNGDMNAPTPFPIGYVTIGNFKYRITVDGRVWLGNECIVEPQT